MTRRMNHAMPPGRKRLMALLADRALCGVSAEQEAEFVTLLRRYPDVNPHCMNNLVAEIDAEIAQIDAEPMPAAMQSLVAKQAESWLNGRGTTTPPKSNTSPKALPRSATPWGAWIAAAACLFIAAAAWWTMSDREPDAARAREAMLKRGEGVMLLNFTSTGDPAAIGASGDVIWHAGQQRGYLRLRGLAANDPTREQYQLWVFDRRRPEETPVDGGVFDVPPGRSEVVIPVSPKLPVDDAYMFAVTIEQPGGVVVSRRERLPIVAKVSDPPCEE